MSVPFSMRLTLARRLGLGFGSLLLMLLVVAGLSVAELRSQGRQVQDIVGVKNEKLALANSMLESINSLSIQARTVTLLTDVKAIDVEMKALADAKVRYANSEKALLDLTGATGADAEEVALMKDIVEGGKKTIPLIERAAKEGEAGAGVEATLTLTEAVRPVEVVWRKKVAQLIEQVRKENAASAEATLASQQRAVVLLAGLLAGAMVIGALLGWRTTRSITMPVARAVKVAERIAEGDLTSTVEITSQDEIGRLLQAIHGMQDRLRALVGDIRHSADSIQTASTEVAVGNQDLSQRTEQTASSLQQAASSMTQLTSTVNQSAEAASQANQMASSASTVARRGGEVVSQVVSTMNEINTSSRKIADIIGVIDGIAFQTNILALNAAVEAARAGEQGRGFAVVAGEVRSLAQRSAEAAKEIKGLIGNSVEKVEAGSRLVSDAGSTMSEIVSSVQRVSGIISEITAAAAEQSSGIGLVSGSVGQLDQMTQQNAALVEQSAAAAESLKGQAARLAELVSVFRLQRDADYIH
ncbi:MAG TPA: methyl-accepting chemotaxis protein [Ideonella sp.]|nr:methyl-accepting chemotaxis protein [Ideonella sp.]